MNKYGIRGISKMKKITVASIAKQAGVSPATVSRVLNHRELVKEETIQCVEDAMKELGRRLGRREQKGQTKKPIILLNIPGVDNVFYLDVIKGARISAKAHGYYLLLHESPLSRGTIQDFCELIVQVDAAGVILLNKILEESLQKISALTPVVQCCEYNEHANVPYVSIDDFKAAESATQYLLSNGRSRIAMINGPGMFNYAVHRQEGFLYALKNAEITIPRQWILQLPEISYEMAYAAVSRLLKSEFRPDAFFAISDVFAAAAVKAVKKYGFRVPEDIMVVGFDNIELSTMTSPAITTVSQPRQQMGYTACEMLLEIIDNPLTEVKSIVLDTELIVRETA